MQSIQGYCQGWLAQDHMALGGDTLAGGGNHRRTVGMAVAVFVRQDPSVDQAGQAARV